MKLSGRMWKLGDDVGATDIVSAQHDKLGMSHEWAECAKHVLETSRPEFVSDVRSGDVILAGRNFGTGHAHYYMTAIMACKTAGIGAMFARSVSGLFQRAAIDAGVAVWEVPELVALASDGDRVEIDLQGGAATNLTTDKTIRFRPLSPIVLDILDAGGSEAWALRRVGYAPAAAAAA